MPLSIMMLGFSLSVEPIPGEASAKQLVMTSHTTGDAYLFPMGDELVKKTQKDLAAGNEALKKRRELAITTGPEAQQVMSALKQEAAQRENGRR